MPNDPHPLLSLVIKWSTGDLGWGGHGRPSADPVLPAPKFPVIPRASCLLRFPEPGPTSPPGPSSSPIRSPQDFPHHVPIGVGPPPPSLIIHLPLYTYLYTYSSRLILSIVQTTLGKQNGAVHSWSGSGCHFGTTAPNCMWTENDHFQEVATQPRNE